MIREWKARAQRPELSRHQAKSRISTSRMCTLMGLAHSTFYKPSPDLSRRESERRTLVDAIEATVLSYPGYGYRRVTAHLRREGRQVNHKRVLQLMRNESLLCRLKRRWVKTTDSSHGLKVWPNLVKDAKEVAWPFALNQLWVADITYVRLTEGFCFLAALLDAHSRRVIGWELSREIDADLTLAALERALLERRPSIGWIHHSDRGVQYACRAYVERLLEAGARISMAAKGCPRENAQAESFFRTLKTEEVYLHPGEGYDRFEDAYASIEHFIDIVYNQKRLHSALGYKPPAEYESHHAMTGEPSNIMQLLPFRRDKVVHR